MSSPNIGNFTQLDIAIHPDFLVKVSHPKASVSSTKSNSRRSTAAQNSIDSLSSFDESTTEDYFNTDDGAHLQLKYAEIITNSDENASTFDGKSGNKVTTKSTLNEVCDDDDDDDNSVNLKLKYNNKNNTTNKSGLAGATSTSINSGNKQQQQQSTNSCSAAAVTAATTTVLDAAQFIRESGILGPSGSGAAMGNVISGLFRKHSKVIPLHHSGSPQTQIHAEPNVTKEQVSLS